MNSYCQIKYLHVFLVCILFVRLLYYFHSPSSVLYSLSVQPFQRQRNLLIPTSCTADFPQIWAMLLTTLKRKYIRKHSVLLIKPKVCNDVAGFIYKVHKHPKNTDKCRLKLISIGHLSVSSCISDASKGGDPTVSPDDWSLTTNMKKFSFSPFLITIFHFPICVHCFFFYCLSYLGIFWFWPKWRH